MSRTSSCLGISCCYFVTMLQCIFSHSGAYHDANFASPRSLLESSSWALDGLISLDLSAIVARKPSTAARRIFQFRQEYHHVSQAACSPSRPDGCHCHTWFVTPLQAGGYVLCVGSNDETPVPRQRWDVWLPELVPGASQLDLRCPTRCVQGWLWHL